MGGQIAGADVGGTKAHVCLATGEAAARELVVASTEWFRDGLRGVAAGLAATIGRLVPAPPDGRPLDALVVGAHGCDTREQCRRLAASLVDLLGTHVIVLNDAELVVPAAGHRSGVGLISGTGSIAVGYDGAGELLAVGGWGGLLGDEGGGAGVFREAARAAARAVDRGEGRDPLVRVLREAFALSDLRDLPYLLENAFDPAAWSARTPALIERSLAEGSRLASRVVAESATALTDLVRVIGARGADTSTIVVAGGLISHAPWLREAVGSSLTSAFPHSLVEFLDRPPVAGALRLARELGAAGGAPRSVPLPGGGGGRL